MEKSSNRTKSSTWRASEAIRNMIFSGELGAGTDHLESELAEKLGMSRTPVREATLMLEGQGLLRIRPRKGVRIAEPTAADMDEIYEVLTELECVSVARAARVGYSAAELQGLLTALNDMDCSLAEGDREGWARADEQFHTELVRLGGNSKISLIVGGVNDQVRIARLQTLHLRPIPVKSVEDHRMLYKAIAESDATKAVEIHQAHREEARHMLIALLRERENNCS